MSTQPLISAQELQQLLINPTKEILLIDASYDLSNPEAGQLLYAQAHIPGAHFLNLGKDLCATPVGNNGRHPLPAQELFAQRLRHIGLNQDTFVIVYDQKNCMFAAHLWWMLLWVGHSQVQVLNGGLEAWKHHHGKLVSDIPPATSQGNFQIQASLAPTVDAHYILKHLNSDKMQLIDARAPERFRGDIEPLDPVAGHIPGALNRPFADNLTEKGLYKAKDELRQEWQQLISKHPLHTLVHYCGSGVSACHNILAMAYSGYPVTMLYPGSWSEWCANPKHPTAKG